MKGLTLKSYEEVRSILREIKDLYPIRMKTMDTVSASGFILGQEIRSSTDVPAFDRSIVDGYAVIDTDCGQASPDNPIRLEVCGQVAMGQVADIKVEQGCTVYVPTGGMIPEGATAMVMIEDVEMAGDSAIDVFRAPNPSDNMIAKGADMKVGEMILEKGRKLSYMDIGALCTLGIRHVQVFDPLTFAVLSTGDELIELDMPQALGQIYDINSHVLSDLIKGRKGQVVYRKIIGDDYDQLRQAIVQATEDADIVFVCGGSSVGVKDYTESIIKSLDHGEIYIHGAAVKPGKPTIVGRGNGKLVFGLPGHPVSSVMSFKMFAEYLMDQALEQGEKTYDFSGVLTGDLKKVPGKTAFVMADVQQVDGAMEVTPNAGISSMITWLTRSKGFVIVDPDGPELKVGQRVSGYYL